ncbi:MAG: hypothetical protein AAFR40_16030, partial [Pseudomonadota bacterium]
MRWINRRPGRVLGTALLIVPFLAVLLAYAIGSDIRRAENPQDKLLPAPAQVVATAQRLVAEPDRRSGRILFWTDTAASLQRPAPWAEVRSGGRSQAPRVRRCRPPARAAADWPPYRSRTGCDRS